MITRLTNRQMRIAVLCSSRGGVLDGLCKVRESGRWPYEITDVITDRECGAEQVAKANQISVTRIVNPGNEAWSRAVASHLLNIQPDAVLLLILRKVGPELWRDLGVCCLNLHPSLLPAYSGLNALERNFADAQAAEARGQDIPMGVTIHLINEHIDRGPIISQRQFTIADAPTLERAHHICFLHKVALMLECVCRHMNGTLPRLQDIPANWDCMEQYKLWKSYEPIVEAQVRLAQPWAVDWLHRNVHEGAAPLLRKALRT